MKAMYERALPEIYQHHRYLFSSNDCAALLLPCQVSLANSFAKRAAWRLEAIFRLVLMFVQKPVATLRAIRAVHFRIGTLQRSLVPMVLQRAGLAPKELSAASDCSDRT
jgi:hypothetical protein